MTNMQQTLGSYLKQAREKRDLSIEEAAFLTKIKKHYLQALEDDAPSAMPSRVQGKGFLRLYADFLNLDEKRVITAWEDPNLIIPMIKGSPHKGEENPVSIPPSTEEAIPKATETADPLPQKPLLQPAEETPEDFQQYIHYDHQAENGLQDEITPQNEGQTPTESQGIFIDIGKTLQEHRQSLHLSLEEIEQYTNIRAHYLKALEEGQIESLPSPVQGRGMLSNYAKFLNINHEDLLLKFADGLQLRRTEQLAPEHRIAKAKQDKSPSSTAAILSKKYLSLDFILTIVLIVSVFSIILFAAAQIASPGLTLETTAPPSISDVLLEKTEAPLENTLTPTMITTSLAGLPIGEDTIEPSEETPIPEGNLPLQLYVIAKQRAFLRITADDKIIFNGRITPGNAYEFSAETQLELLTGNAAALEVYFNQETLGSLGIESEVISLLFTLDQGFITPTPQFSPTPTNTLEPSVTVTPTPTATQTIAVPTSTVTPFIP